MTSYRGLHAPPLREECHASSFQVWSLDIREVIGLPRVTWWGAGMKSAGEKGALAQVFRGFLSMGGGGSPGRLVDACETGQAVLITVAGEAGSGTECVWGVSR